MFCVLPMFLQVGVLNQLAKTAKFETNKSYFVKSFSVGKSFWTCMFISFVCVCCLYNFVHIDILECVQGCVSLSSCVCWSHFSRQLQAVPSPRIYMVFSKASFVPKRSYNLLPSS